jgi:hypothetical protein
MVEAFIKSHLTNRTKSDHLDEYGPFLETSYHQDQIIGPYPFLETTAPTLRTIRVVDTTGGREFSLAFL